jgi:hypothetical protein
VKVKRFMKVGKVCALLSALELCFPVHVTQAGAAEPGSPPVQQQRRASAPAKLSMDVITSARGELRGAVVNRDSAPSVNAKVVLCMVSGKETQEATTDASGRFVFTHVRPGMYTLAVNGTSGQSQSIARVWTPETAPPAASPVALVSLQNQNPRQDDVVRGQDIVTDEYCDEGGGGLFGGGGAGLLLGAALVGGAVVGIVAIAGGFDSGGQAGGQQAPASP